MHDARDGCDARSKKKKPKNQKWFGGKSTAADVRVSTPCSSACRALGGSRGQREGGGGAAGAARAGRGGSAAGPQSNSIRRAPEQFWVMLIRTADMVLLHVETLTSGVTMLIRTVDMVSLHVETLTSGVTWFRWMLKRSPRG